MGYRILRFLRHHLELIFWVCGMLLLALSDPASSHFTVCPLHLAGWEHCPGCGLGHAIGFLFRGEWAASLHAHPLGIPALFFILLRIYRILSNKHYPYKNDTHGRPVYDPAEPESC